VLRPVLVVALALTLFVNAFPVVILDLGGRPEFFYRLLIFPGDIGLVVIVLAVIPLLGMRRVRVEPATALLGILAVLLVIAWAFHPSPQGAMIVLRCIGATAVACAVSSLEPHERIVVIGTLAAAALMQEAIAIAQIANRMPLGIPSFGEVANPFLVYGGTPAPRGTMHGQYLLGGLALMTSMLVAREALERRRSVLAVLAGIVAVPVGFTFGRAMLGAVLLSTTVLAVGDRRERRLLLTTAGAIAGAVLLTVALTFAGWTDRLTYTIANGRDVLFEEARAMIASSPLVGVGPGRSIELLREMFPGRPDSEYQPAHAMPVLAAVEGGLAAGGVVLVMLGVLGWRTRRDVRAAALLLAYLPAVLTDQYALDFAQGLVMLGLWVGALDGLAARPVAAVPFDRAITARINRTIASWRTTTPKRISP